MGKEISILAFLGLNSLLDIKKKEISLWLTGFYGLAGILVSLQEEKPVGDFNSVWNRHKLSLPCYADKGKRGNGGWSDSHCAGNYDGLE